MSKQSSSGRVQKGKGYFYAQTKFAVQMGFLVAACVWLVYQATKFGDRKAVLTQAGISQSHAAVFQGGKNEVQLGRKGLDRFPDKVAGAEEETDVGGDEEEEMNFEIDDMNSSRIQKIDEEADHENEKEQLEDLIDETDSGDP